MVATKPGGHKLLHDGDWLGIAAVHEVDADGELCSVRMALCPFLRRSKKQWHLTPFGAAVLAR